MEAFVPRSYCIGISMGFVLSFPGDKDDFKPLHQTLWVIACCGKTLLFAVGIFDALGDVH